MSKFVHEPPIIQQRKRRKLSPNRHCKIEQNNRNKNNRNVDDKYKEDLHQTNQYLKKKLRMMQQSHSQELFEIKQQHISKQRNLESKALKLTSNLKKLGKMYQTLQNEYDKLLHQHRNVLNIDNSKQNMHRNTVYDEDEDSNHIKYAHDPDVTMMGYIDNHNKQNECNARQTQEFLLSPKVSVLNEYKDHSNDGFSLQWNEGSVDEYHVLEKIMERNNSNQYERKCDTNEDNTIKKSEIMTGSPFKYVETVRGKKRNELPGHECVQCEKFYALNKDMQMTREKFCNCVSRHRAKHKLPATPSHFWDIDFATQR